MWREGRREREKESEGARGRGSGERERIQYHSVFLVTYPPAKVINDASEKNKGVDTAYADLIPGYPADLRMAEDLATFVRIIIYN